LSAVPPIADGSTRLFGVVGDPIVQVRAPGVWSALFRHNGINALCVPMHVHPPSLPTFLAGIRTLDNLQGLIVTIPHKPAMLALVDEVTPRARQVGVANAVAVLDDGRTRADTFDGFGLLAGLRAAGQNLARRRALIVGSGGVGASIAFAVAEAGATSLAISDIDGQRAQALASRLQSAGYRAQVGPADPAGCDLVINATPVGMQPTDPLPIDCTRLDAAAIVVDVVISPGLTPFLSAARERGCFVQTGAVMTDYMIAAMAEFFGFASGDFSAATIARLMGGGA
jgi:shikimate dehydrogenase